MSYSKLSRIGLPKTVKKVIEKKDYWDQDYTPWGYNESEEKNY